MPSSNLAENRIIAAAEVAELDNKAVHDQYFDWHHWALAKQLPPPGDWITWLLMGGRGSGKTRAGAEWVRQLAREGVGPIALVGETMVEALDIMVRGESGIMAVHPEVERPRLSGKNHLHWPNGVQATILTASDPERFRGPQFAAAWCDEIGKWPHAEEAWDMLQFSLRLGDNPRQLATTTPRATPLMRRLLKDERTAVVWIATEENRAQLAPNFLDAVVARYRGTVLGRQAAQTSLDIHNASAQWNKALLDNAARPSGALVYSAGAGSLTEEQYNRLKEEMEAQFSGSANAGRPMVLDGGLDWKAMALTPRDMDFIEARHAAARDIALAFGVPPMLLGIPGDNTYANLAEANRALWRQTLVPLVMRVAQELSEWLGPAFEGAQVLPDFDGVEALAEDRAALWARVGAAEFLSDAEKREMVGLGGAGLATVAGKQT